jgi:hypothetical protein
MLTTYELNLKHLDERDADPERVMTPYARRHEVEQECDISIHQLTLEELRGTHYLRERLERNNDGIDDLHPVIHNGGYRYQETALIAAARRGYLPKVHLLIKAGADIDKTDDRECSALYWSVHYGHTEVARMLLTAGASTRTDLHTTSKNDPKYTLFTLAVSTETYGSNLPYDVWGMVFMLLEHQKNIDYLYQAEEYLTGQVPDGGTYSHKLDINEQDSWGNTALHYTKDEALMVLLLDNGADVDLQDIQGNTPLNIVMKRCSARNLPGREFIHRDFVSDKEREIAKQDAIKEFIDTKVTLASLLLEKGADALIEDDEGDNSVTWANNGCGELMPVLVDPYRVDDYLQCISHMRYHPAVQQMPLYERKVIEKTLLKCVRGELRPPRELFVYEHGDKFNQVRGQIR